MTLLYKWLTEATRAQGSAKALVYRDTYLSWRGLSHRVDRRVQEFVAMGIKKGDWVGLMLGNVPDFAILALALSKVGAVVVPLDPTTGTRDLGLIMDSAPVRALITRPRGGVETQQPAPPSASGRLENLESRRRLQGTLLTCSIYKKSTITSDPAALVLYTNDSSGNPKGVLRTDENLEAAAVQTAKALEITADDRILTTVPLYHSYGFDCGLLLALRFGATLYLEDEVAPKRIVKLLREQEINVLPGTPGLYAGLAKLPTAKALKIKRPRYLSAGSSLSESTADAFKDRWGIRITPVYHTTETSTIACDKKEPRPGSVGKVVEGVEVRVGDGHPKNGNGAGEVDGAIWVKSKSVARKSMPQARARGEAVAVGGVDDKGWLRTGDIGHFDKTGRIYLTGREDQLVKVDGKRVALGEVQECLESFAKVQQAQVRVITDPLGGPMVVASVVVMGKSGPGVAEEIIDHCAKNLAPYKVPRRIEFCETLPIA
ncbi:MAG TPA: class I adenylate-forming enzyme family protein [Polyangia bacterium]|nr:class I adenylate-forming enzyme family protein [Polyangia bacterium]